MRCCLIVKLSESLVVCNNSSWDFYEGRNHITEILIGDSENLRFYEIALASSAENYSQVFTLFNAGQI